MQKSRDPEETLTAPLQPSITESEMTLRNGALAFLADVREFPESGVAERYKRMGLSVRQGQKLKEVIVEKGLVREQVQTTRSGKLRVIRLTEQGKLSLSDTADPPSEAA